MATICSNVPSKIGRFNYSLFSVFDKKSEEHSHVLSNSSYISFLVYPRYLVWYQTPLSTTVRECNRSGRPTFPSSNRPRFHQAGRDQTWDSRFDISTGWGSV